MNLSRIGLCGIAACAALASFAFLGLFPGSARAADAGVATEPTVLFPQGTFTLTDYAGYAGGLDRNDHLVTGTVGFGYFLWNNVSISLEAEGAREYVPGQDTHDAWGFGLSGVYRNHLITCGRASLFADVAFGPLESTARIPSGGTEFNFAFRSGVGATYQLDDHLHLLGGVRYFHLSNARLEGPARNPSINGIEGYFGLMWTF